METKLRTLNTRKGTKTGRVSVAKNPTRKREMIGRDGKKINTEELPTRRKR